MNNINYKQSFLRLMSYYTEFKLKITIVMLLLVVAAISAAISPMFFKVLIDDYIIPLTMSSNPDFSNLLNTLVILAGIYLIGILSSFFANYILVKVSEEVMLQIRKEAFSKMQALPLKFFDERQFGDIMSHYTNDIDVLNGMLTFGLPGIYQTVIGMLFVLVAMLMLNVPLTIVVLIGSLVMLFITKKFGKKSGDLFFGLQKTTGELTGYIEEAIGGAKVVKVFNQEEQIIEGFDAINTKLYEDNKNAEFYASLMMPLNASVSSIIYILIAFAAGLLLNFNLDFGITIGVVIAFLQLSKSFTMPLAEVSGQVNFIVMSLAGAERIFNLMDEEKEENNGTVELVKKDSLWYWKDGDKEVLLKGDVRFNNVDFSYVEGKPVLKNISLFAKPGQKIAFVGATGAGKTTITNLINRFYDINSGEILYDGIDLKRIKKEDLRTSLGMVLQDVNLFSGTVYENIKYGKDDATNEEVIEAAKLAGADDFINMLPNGYDTVLDSNGSNLSQGQCQLLSIARAALLDPPVMILDEATSSIDTQTESIVQAGMDRLMQNRTVFVIAHRLSTVRNSNAIMVLEQGEIVERGEHEELINSNGIYHKLYTGAFELE